MPPQGRRGAGYFVDRFPFVMQCHQQLSDQLLVTMALHHLIHDLRHLLHREMLTGLDAYDRFLDHDNVASSGG